MAVIKLGDLTTFTGSTEGAYFVMNDSTNTATYKVQKEGLMSGSFFGTASLALTASSADSFTVRQDLSGSNALFTGNITAQTLVVQYITSSTELITGSSKFGTQLTDTHQFTGSVSVTGSTELYGVSSFTGISSSDSAPLGSELLSSANWTSAGWTGDYSTGFTHSTGNTTALTNTLAAVVGTYYQITYTITGRTAGSVTITFGGVSFPTISVSSARGPRAVSTGTLSIAPTTDFNGTIVISIKEIGQSSPSIRLINSSGIVTNEIRNTTPSNTFIGLNAGLRSTTAVSNSFYGNGAGQNTTTGTQNSAFGVPALGANTTGTQNSAFGSYALYTNLSGSQNSAFGSIALSSNTNGSYNAAFGLSALASNTTGSFNSAFGINALYFNSSGTNNTAFGASALQNNTLGSNNLGVGISALFSITTGNNNAAFGYNAGRYAGASTTANQTSNNSLYLGYQTRASANGNTNEIVIGYDTLGLGSNTTVLGNSSTVTTGVYGNLLLGTTTTTGERLQVTGNTRLSGSVNVTGSFTVITGSNIEFQVLAQGVKIGNLSTDVHTVTGSLNATGSLTVNSSDFVVTGSISGSIVRIGSSLAAIQGGLYVPKLYVNPNFTQNRAGIHVAQNTAGTVLNYLYSGYGAESEGILGGMRLQYVHTSNGNDQNGNYYTYASDGRFGYYAFTKIESSGNVPSGSNGFASNLYFQNTGASLTGSGNYFGYKSVVQFATSPVLVGTVSDYYMDDIRGTVNGTLTNRYGVHITFTSASVTNPWGIYQTSNTINNHFNGGVYIGTATTGSFKLDVSGSGRFTNGLQVTGSLNATGSLSLVGPATITGTSGSDGGQLGAELLSSANWTSTDWTGDYTTGFTHTVGNTTALTNTLAAVTNNYYQITYTVTNRTAGTFSITFGGVTSSAITATGAVGPRATSTGTLSITPTTDFDGTIVISIKVISVSSALISYYLSNGTVVNEIRLGNISSNIFTGVGSGARITTGTFNTGYGLNSLQNTTSGTGNTAYGRLSLTTNTVGNNNSAFGRDALSSNLSGDNNSAFGASSLGGNTSGANNTSHGQSALQNNSTGNNNSAFGQAALVSNQTGGSNSAFGFNALYSNTTTSNNTAVGYQAGRFAGPSTTANQTSNNSIYLGYQTRASASGDTNEIVIGYNVVGLGSNTTIIGNSSTVTTGIYGNLLLGTTSSTGERLQVTGTAKVTGSLNVTGSVSITSLLTLGTSDPLPTSNVPSASLMASGSGSDLKPYFWNGASWTALF